MWLTLLAKYWKSIALVALVAAFGLYWHHLTSTITAQETTIAAQKQAISTYEENTRLLTNSINNMNASIDKLSESTSRVNTQFDALSKTVVTQVKGLKVQQTTILAEPKPTTCTDTIKYLIDAVPEYAK